MFWGLVQGPQKEKASTLAILKAQFTPQPFSSHQVNLFLSSSPKVVSGWNPSDS